jgi:hypothetical protein
MHQFPPSIDRHHSPPQYQGNPLIGIGNSQAAPPALATQARRL